MKKIYKKTLAIVLSVLLILPLSSCSIKSVLDSMESCMLSQTPFEGKTSYSIYSLKNIGRQSWNNDWFNKSAINGDILYYYGTQNGRVIEKSFSLMKMEKPTISLFILTS